MSRRCPAAVAAFVLLAAIAGDAMAVRIMTTPSTLAGDPDLEFSAITLTPDGNTIVATGQFNAALPPFRERVYTLPVPANPVTDTETLTRITTNSFLVPEYDVDFAPVVSPDGQTVLHVHNGNNRDNTIHRASIAGEGSNVFDGLFTTGNNQASPGTSNFDPRFSPQDNGQTVFFLNANSGFGGSPPGGSFSPDTADTWRGGSAWTQIYSVPAAGGTPTAITPAGDGTIAGGGGSIDRNLWTITPNGQSIVYAPDVAITEDFVRGDQRTKLFSIPAAGGTPAEIAIAPASHDGFSISRQVDVTPDGSQVLFIGDYETRGRYELFSVPITGGVPTRINDDLAFAGDVSGFQISPDGTAVAYAAGQNVSATNELFLKDLSGAAGSSIRVSDAPTMNDGRTDVFFSPAATFSNTTFSTRGVQAIQFANDGNSIFYLGDYDTEGVTDLYVVDTSSKGGAIPSAFTFVGPDGGDFFDESNWQDAQGNPAPPGSLNPDSDIAQSLVIGSGVNVAAAGQAFFVEGASLEVGPGSTLDFVTGVSGSGGEARGVQFEEGSGLKLDNATLTVDSNIRLNGQNSIVDSSISATGTESDLYFDRRHESVVSGSTLSATDFLGFFNSMPELSDSTLTGNLGFGLKFEADIVLQDTEIFTNGEIQDPVNEGADNTTITLRGDSALTGSAVREGVSVLIDDNSSLILNGFFEGFLDINAPNPSTITIIGENGEIVLNGDDPSPIDISGSIINGLTGLSYAEDPSVWNVTNWDGQAPIGLLRLASESVQLFGDYNDDGQVDAADYTLWRDNLGQSVVLSNDLTEGEVTQEDYIVWRDNYGLTTDTIPNAVPEPSGLLLIVATLSCYGSGRRRCEAGVSGLPRSTPGQGSCIGSRWG